MADELVGQVGFQSRAAVEEFDKLTLALQRYTGAIDKVVTASSQFNTATQQWETYVQTITTSGTVIAGTVAKTEGGFKLLGNSLQTVNAATNLADGSIKVYDKDLNITGTTILRNTQLQDSYTTALQRTIAAQQQASIAAANSRVVPEFRLEGMTDKVATNLVNQQLKNIQVSMFQLFDLNKKFNSALAEGTRMSEQRWLAENRGVRSVLASYNLLNAAQTGLRNLTPTGGLRIVKGETTDLQRYNNLLQSYSQLLNQVFGGIQNVNAATIQGGAAARSRWIAEERALRSLSIQYDLAAVKARVYSAASTMGRDAFAPATSALNAAVQRNKTLLNEFATANESAINRSINSWRFWARFIVTQSAHRLIYAFINGVTQGIKAVTNLEAKISEIRTISQGTQQLPFENWVTEVKKLSDTFGTTLEDIVEGAYQTLSNQIAKGTDAIGFMNEALKFARAAVTDTTNAVNLGSSVINAYGLSAASAGEAFASTFKLIELGRVRAEEIADSYGRVLVAASQLNVPLDELGAILSVLTIQGKKPAVAMTELRNIFLKIIKPTEALKKVFDSWGVSSGAAAVQTYGIIGVINKLDQELKKMGEVKLGDASEEMATLFNSIRALSGMLSVTGKHTGELEATMAKFSGKMQYYANAQAIAVESAGKRMQIQYTQLRNYFVETLGRDLLTVIDTVVKKFGGLVEIVKTTMKWLSGGLVALAAYHASLKAMLTIEGIIRFNIAMSETLKIMKAQIILATLQGNTATASALKVVEAEVIKQRAMQTTNRLIAISSLAIAAGVVYISNELFKLASHLASVNIAYKQLTGTGATSADALTMSFAKLNDTIIEYYNNLTKANDEQTKLMLQAMAFNIAGLNNQVATLEKTFDVLAERGATFLDSAIKIFQGRIKAIDKAIDEIVQRIEKSNEVIKNINRGELNSSFYDRIVESVGKIDKEWQKAYKNLEIYNSYLKAGKEYQLVPETGKPQTEIQIFAKQLEALKSYRKVLEDIGRGAYLSGELDYAREIFSKLLSQSDDFYKFGYSLNQVFVMRLSLLDQQAKIEAGLKTKEEERLRQAEILRQQEELRLRILERERIKLREIKPTHENIKAISDAYREIISKVSGTITGALSPQVQAQFNALISDQATLEQTAELTAAIDRVTTDKIQSVETLKSVLSEQLQTIIDLEQTRQTRADLEARAAEVSKRSDDINKQIEEVKQTRLALTQKVESITSAISESYRRVIDSIDTMELDKPIEKFRDDLKITLKKLIAVQPKKGIDELFIRSELNSLGEQILKSKNISELELVGFQLEKIANSLGEESIGVSGLTGRTTEIVPTQITKDAYRLILDLEKGNIEKLNLESIRAARKGLQDLLDAMSKQFKLEILGGKSIAKYTGGPEYRDVEQLIAKIFNFEEIALKFQQIEQKDKQLNDQLGVTNYMAKEWTDILKKGTPAILEYLDALKKLDEFVAMGLEFSQGVDLTEEIANAVKKTEPSDISINLGDIEKEINDGDTKIITTLKGIKGDTGIMSDAERARRALIGKLSQPEELPGKVRPIKLGVGLDPFRDFKGLMRDTTTVFDDFVESVEARLERGTSRMWIDPQTGKPIDRVTFESMKRQARVLMNRLYNPPDSMRYGNYTPENRAIGIQRGWTAPIQSRQAIDITLTVKSKGLAQALTFEIEQDSARGLNNMSVKPKNKNP
jgi:TP901 family phage tail tape measure protein